MGPSGNTTETAQAKLFGDAWELLPAPRPQLSLEIAAGEDARSYFVNLGPHPPRLWPEDVELVHRLWLDLSSEAGHKVHHRDVVRLALRRLEGELGSGERHSIVSELRQDPPKS